MGCIYSDANKREIGFLCDHTWICGVYSKKTAKMDDITIVWATQ